MLLLLFARGQSHLSLSLKNDDNALYSSHSGLDMIIRGYRGEARAAGERECVRPAAVADESDRREPVHGMTDFL